MPTDQTYPVELSPPDIEPYRAGNTGVPFITTFDSGTPGPHVMIAAVTHGNELCGAIAVDHLMRQQVRPRRGRLTLGFLNHEAYNRFDAANPAASRFVDEDFNRVWVENRLDSDENTVELRRAREVRPILDDVDMLLDIHSMGTLSRPLMICNGLDKEVRATRDVAYPGFVMCGSGHIVGKRIIEYTPFNDTSNGKVAMLVECGQHWAKETGVAAMDTAAHFLRATDTVDRDTFESLVTREALEPPVPDFWEVTHGITAKTNRFRFSKPWIGMEVLPDAGTVFAHDGDEALVTPYDNCLLMMPNHKGGQGMRKLRLCRRMAGV